MNDVITIEQIKAARAMLGIKQAKLANLAKVSTGTLNNIERGVQANSKLSTIKAIRQALEAEGVEFLSQASGGMGLRLKLVTKHRTTLIIDSGYADRKRYKTWLTQDNDKKYRVVEAGSAKDGYEAYIEEKPDCIILDVMLSDKDGLQLLLDMKKQKSNLPPIIFAAGLPNETLKRDALALGARAYYDKRSLTKEKLCEAVAQVLQ